MFLRRDLGHHISLSSYSFVRPGPGIRVQPEIERPVSETLTKGLIVSNPIGGQVPQRSFPEVLQEGSTRYGYLCIRNRGFVGA